MDGRGDGGGGQAAEAAGGAGQNGGLPTQLPQPAVQSWPSVGWPPSQYPVFRPQSYVYYGAPAPVYAHPQFAPPPPPPPAADALDSVPPWKLPRQAAAQPRPPAGGIRFSVASSAKTPVLTTPAAKAMQSRKDPPPAYAAPVHAHDA